MTIRKAAETLLDALHGMSLYADDATQNKRYCDAVDALRAALEADTVELPRVPTQAMYAAWMCDAGNWTERYRVMIAEGGK